MSDFRALITASQLGRAYDYQYAIPGQNVDYKRLELFYDGTTMQTYVSGLTDDEVFDDGIILFKGKVATTIYIDDFHADDPDFLIDELENYGYNDHGLNSNSTYAQCCAALKTCIDLCYDTSFSPITAGANVFERTDDTVTYEGVTYQVWEETSTSDGSIIGLMPLHMYGRDLYPYSLLANGTNYFCPFEIIALGGIEGGNIYGEAALKYGFTLLYAE